jgi:hypothetical protein
VLIILCHISILISLLVHKLTESKFRNPEIRKSRIAGIRKFGNPESLCVLVLRNFFITLGAKAGVRTHSGLTRDTRLIIYEPQTLFPFIKSPLEGMHRRVCSVSPPPKESHSSKHPPSRSTALPGGGGHSAREQGCLSWSEANTHNTHNTHTAHEYQLLMQRMPLRDEKRSQSPVREPEQRSSARVTPRTFTSRASTQKPQHIKDSFRRRLPSDPPAGLPMQRHLHVPDGRLDQHVANSAELAERPHRGAERDARRASHSSSPYRAREPRPPQHATTAQREPGRLVRSATLAMAPVLAKVLPGKGDIVTSEEEPEDKVAAWLAKTAKFSPLPSPSVGSEDLAMQPRRREATYHLAVRWLFAYLWATLVGFCTCLARGFSVAGTRTDDDSDASDRDAASSNASSASENDTLTLEKALRGLEVARRGVDKAAQRWLRAQNRVASWQHQVAQMREADKKRDDEKRLNKCRHWCGASSLEKTYLATI